MGNSQNASEFASNLERRLSARHMQLDEKEWSESTDALVEEEGWTKAARVMKHEYGAAVGRIYKACAHRALFVTSKGYIGLAPWNAKSGDFIFVFNGGKTPFLLREIPGGRYKLVGEAYVHGIMGGVALDLCSESVAFRLV